MRHAVIAIFLAAAGLAGGVVTAGNETAPPSHTVEIDGTQFNPARLTIKVGEAVTWINRDPFPHTATSVRRAFDSGSLAPGQSWRHVFDSPGTYPYLCTLHPTMKGVIRVQ
ncbi:MAG TPA: cupredoxin family copper-binding protein [Burkholderiales bacterium]|nr:cupredoxin family copper-binding protein [Burkholderiales bacterium]